MEDHEKERTKNAEDTHKECTEEKVVLTLQTERKRSEELLTRLKYLQADFENLKRRTERQVEDARKYGNERLVTELLGVVDELELAVKSGRESDCSEALLEGVEITLKKLKRVLESQGVVPIEALGKHFDPSLHEAVAKVEKNDVEDCTVIEEVRKGYMMKEKVIRPAIVKVSVKHQYQEEENEVN